MRTLCLISVATLMSVCSHPAAHAQYGYDPGYDVINQLQASNQMLQQQMDQTWQQYYSQYRQQSGDWSTPDQVLQQNAMNDFYARNPQAYQQHMNQQQRITNRIFDNWNSSMEMRADSWRHYNEVSDRHQHQVDNAIRSQADYVNPETGQVWNLPYGEPGYYQSPYNTFYQNSGFQQYQYTPGGYWQELNEIR